MPSLPPRTAQCRLGAAVCCLVLLTGVGLAAGTGPTAPAASQPVPDLAPDRFDQSCEHDDYDLAPLAGSREETYADPLDDDSLADWDGGRIVRVGATGDCSLAVTDGTAATLTSTTVDGTGGIVTGTLDLGSNGSLRFVAADEAATPTPGTDESGSAVTEARHTGATTSAPANPTTASGAPETGTPTARPPGNGTPTARTVENGTPTTGLVIENDGPDFAAAAVVRSGARSEPVALPSGRFFRFTVRWGDDGGVRVAVWDAATSWDREWDVRFENATVREAWRVRLHGRAFLDAIAVGVADAPESPGATGPDGEPGSGDDGPGPDDEDGFPGPYPGTEFDEYRSDSESGGSDGGTVFLGLLLFCGGALGYRFAYGLAMLDEQFDAIGSTTPASEVEPAGWNVMLTKLLSALGAVVGLGLIAVGIL